MKKIYTTWFLALTVVLYSCNGNGTVPEQQSGTVKLPVYQVTEQKSSTSQELPAKLEGQADVEIRPLVDGYLQKIYVDEGTHVAAGQLLFKIEDHKYREALNNANGVLNSANAALINAKLEVEKLTPLVKDTVVSDYQLRTAKASIEIAEGNRKQALAAVESAKINLGYTSISAPIAGYITRLPKKQGSMVSASAVDALTTLSDNSKVYAYFSMSEPEFTVFKEQYTGNTLNDKIKQVPPVTLLLSGNVPYEQQGHIDMIDGQVDKNTGAITFRATFPNSKGVLRSGNSGRIKMSLPAITTLLVPQEATLEEQGKVYVYKVNKAGKVERAMIIVSGKTETAYLITSGLQSGDMIVYKGFDGLQDGTVITPEKMTANN